MAEKSAAALVKEFFGMTLQEMKTEWMKLPPNDKAEIVEGLRDGSLNY